MSWLIDNGSKPAPAEQKKKRTQKPKPAEIEKNPDLDLEDVIGVINEDLSAETPEEPSAHPLWKNVNVLRGMIKLMGIPIDNSKMATVHAAQAVITKHKNEMGMVGKILKHIGIILEHI
jgi:hypothetical protein